MRVIVHSHLLRSTGLESWAENNDTARRMRLAIFDLDNTLLDGDSDYLWGVFLVEQGRVDSAEFEHKNLAFYEQYQAGTLDIEEFAQFSMKPLASHRIEDLHRWRKQFIAEKIVPNIATLAPALLEKHRTQGDELLIMTATNRFITAPIAQLLGVEQLIATDPEMIDGRYTGRLSGTPNFREGKVKRLDQWLAQRGERNPHITFYSDSHNDLPLLERADLAIAVSPDDILKAEAERRGWPIISLSGPPISIEAP